jgi:hypothetical protein
MEVAEDLGVIFSGSMLVGGMVKYVKVKKGM